MLSDMKNYNGRQRRLYHKSGEHYDIWYLDADCTQRADVTLIDKTPNIFGDAVFCLVVILGLVLYFVTHPYLLVPAEDLPTPQHIGDHK